MQDKFNYSIIRKDIFYIKKILFIKTYGMVSYVKLKNDISYICVIIISQNNRNSSGDPSLKARCFEQSKTSEQI